MAAENENGDLFFAFRLNKCNWSAEKKDVEFFSRAVFSFGFDGPSKNYPEYGSIKNYGLWAACVQYLRAYNMSKNK